MKRKYSAPELAICQVEPAKVIASSLGIEPGSTTEMYAPGHYDFEWLENAE